MSHDHHTNVFVLYVYSGLFILFTIFVCVIYRNSNFYIHIYNEAKKNVNIASINGRCIRRSTTQKISFLVYSAETVLNSSTKFNVQQKEKIDGIDEMGRKTI